MKLLPETRSKITRSQSEKKVKDEEREKDKIIPPGILRRSYEVVFSELSGDGPVVWT